MKQKIDALKAVLKDLLPKALKPHTSKIVGALAVLVALILLGSFLGFRFLFIWFLGTLFLIVFMAAWVVISEFLKKIDK
jgi:hypothetical protein